LLSSIALLVLVTPSISQAYGEQEDGYPTMEELWVEVLTSSCRQDPDAYGWSSYSPIGALWHHHGLNEVARNHSEDMAARDYFEHDSIDGTSWDTRISEYYGGSMIGENIAAGYAEPISVLDGWLNSDGHRENIFTAAYQEIGIGVGYGGSYGIYWTQDFGGGPAADPHPVTGAAASEAGGEVTVWAVLQTSGDAPEVQLAVGETCAPMALIHGQADAGTYEASLPADGDTPWRVFVRLEDGSEAVWPDQGAWTSSEYDGDAITVDCLDADAGDDDDGGGLPIAAGCGANESPFGPQNSASFALLGGLVLLGRRRVSRG